MTFSMKRKGWGFLLLVSVLVLNSCNAKVRNMLIPEQKNNGIQLGLGDGNYNNKIKCNGAGVEVCINPNTKPVSPSIDGGNVGEQTNTKEMAWYSVDQIANLSARFGEFTTGMLGAMIGGSLGAIVGGVYYAYPTASNDFGKNVAAIAAGGAKYGTLVGAPIGSYSFWLATYAVYYSVKCAVDAAKWAANAGATDDANSAGATGANDDESSQYYSMQSSIAE